MYHLFAILFGLIVLSVLLLRMRPIRLPPVQGFIFGRAAFAHRCAIANYQKLLEDFNSGVYKQKGASTVVVYPEWIREYVTDLPMFSIPCQINPFPKIGGGYKYT